MAANGIGSRQNSDGQDQQAAEHEIVGLEIDVLLELPEQDQADHREEDRSEHDDLLPGRLRPGQARTAQHRQRDQDRILRDPVEHVGRDEAGCNAADHAAERHPHVERRQIARGRPSACELAVAHQREDEEHRKVDRHHADDQPDRLVNDDRDQREDEDRLNLDHQPMRNDRLAREHDHEGEKIERERNDPEQRNRGDVGRDMGGHRDQQSGRNGREEDPAYDIAPGRRR